MKLVIGLVGRPLAGKETVGEIIMRELQKRAVTSVRERFRDLLEETLILWNIDRNRDNLQKLAQVMVAPDAFGPDALSDAVEARFINKKEDVVLADGVRWLSDEMMIRNLPQGRGLLLYIAADAETRFSRVQKRKREGEEGITKEKFLAQDEAKNEINIDAIGSRADGRIENNEGASMENLETQVRKFLEEKVFPSL